VAERERKLNALAYELRPKGVPEANVEGVWVDGGRDWGVEAESR